jgi:glycosyltransferase involved in cell wall biosynthesis
MFQHKVQATILFLSYNQEDFVAESAKSCLAQLGEPLDIIFSDDCSTDKTYAILQDLVRTYAGPHQVRIRQNSRNLGIADHYNILVKLARCDLLITAAGDDISYPNRAQTLFNAWMSSGYKLDLIASYAQSFTHDGQDTNQEVQVDQLARWRGPADWCRKRPYVVGATHAFTKRIWTEFGDIASDIPYEDQIVTLRALCLGGGLTVQKKLLNYRAGGVSSKGSLHEPNERFAALERRYSRQRAVFAQVRNDLEQAGHSILWNGKVKKYWTRAQAALQLLQWHKENHHPSLRELVQMTWQCGIFWTPRQVFYTWK